ncbi:MAG: beta-propeller fold lactonase family protein [Solirubrobacteraceae bacterium]
MAALCLLPGTAVAYFSGAGSGAAQARVAELSVPGGLSAVLAGGEIEIKWTASSIGGSVPASSYTVERYSEGGADLGPAACSPVAAGTGAPNALGSFSCAERPAPGSYEYRVTAHYESWSTRSARTGPVELATSQTSLAVSANPASVGAPVLYTATVEGAPSGTPGGAVRFHDGSGTVPNCAEVALAGTSPHRATCEVEYREVGTHAITAEYLGNGPYPASSSAPLSETVGRGEQSIAFPSLPPRYLNEAATATATASSSLPVALASSTPGTCAVSGGAVTLLATGTCTIEATQGGDEDWRAASPVTRSFAISNPPAGPLTPLEPAFVESGSGPARVTVSPDGKNAYATDRFAASVSQYARDPETGALTALAAATVAAGEEPEGVAVAPGGAYVYVANRASNSISEYGRNAETGALQPLEPGSVAAEFAPIGLAVSPNGENLYVVDSKSEQVGEYRIEADGQLVSLTPSSTGAGANAHGVLVSPDGRDVYVTNYNSGTVGMYSVGTGGVLSPIGEIGAGVNPHDLAISADGRDVYVADNVESGVVEEFARDPETGALSSIGSVQAGRYPECVVVSPAGEAVYVTDEISGGVSQYARNAGTGLLAPLTPATIAAGAEPEGIAIAPDGKNVYVVNRTSGTVSQYRR